MSIINEEYIINTLVEILKGIEEQWKIDTFKRYRECGTEMLKAGWTNLWNPEMKEKLMGIVGYKKSTVELMVKLGKMPEQEFSDTIGNFKSLYAWSHPKKEVTHKEINQKEHPECFTVEEKYMEIVQKLLALSEEINTKFTDSIVILDFGKEEREENIRWLLENITDENYELVCVKLPKEAQ